ncbi:endolytic transglycosylase MltG [Ketobacter nezhaii]|mgnify:CR=1 FL=1|uniref:endolytic transglycosylase MltG n=1 Tax=Ketobacter sp. MCCC 1A13808 TaxID=2602738 RepID=UPI00268F71A9|nr:endolytic transglycosylase MltG [Ketobacter sp. MCCC 1A13808]
MSLKRISKSILVLLILAVLAVIGGKACLNHWGEAPLKLDQDRVIVVPSGFNFHRLSRQWQAEGLIEHALLLRAYLRINNLGNLVQAGEYHIASGTTPRQLINKIQSGDVIQYAVTLIDGHTFNQFVETLQGDPRLAKEFQQLGTQALLEQLNSPYSHPEGLFYPDTYHFKAGDSDLDILRRAYQRMNTLLETSWAGKADALPYNSPYEALTMASIVERETAVSSERSLIAGVFVNRLRKNMRLQTDPTVIYGLGAEYQGNITRAHLKAYTPYNTYRIKGLPPTPIANPALPAIEAALHPATTKALYFVAKGDGSHQFSTTLEEHQKAVRQFQWQRRSDYRSSPVLPRKSATQ